MSYIFLFKKFSGSNKDSNGHRDEKLLPVKANLGKYASTVFVSSSSILFPEEPVRGIEPVTVG